MSRPEETAQACFDNYVSCHHSHRWIYKETLVVKHIPELLREIRHLRAVNEELSAEVARLSRIAQY